MTTSGKEVDDLLFRVRELQQGLPEMVSEKTQNGAFDCFNKMFPSVDAVPEHDIGPSLQNQFEPTLRGCLKRNTNVPSVRNIVKDADQNGGKNYMQNENVISVDLNKTIELLQLVTYVRIVIDKLYWEERAPSFIERQLSPVKTLHDQRKIVIKYEFPTPNDERISQSLRQKVCTFAKMIFPQEVHFNHRKVALVQITQQIVQLWSKASLTFHVYYQSPIASKFAPRHIGECHIPLRDLLQSPFSIDVQAPLVTSGMYRRARISICIQLGSRTPAFSDQVDPLRCSSRPSSMSIDPDQLSSRLPKRSTSPLFLDDEHLQPTIVRNSVNEHGFSVDSENLCRLHSRKTVADRLLQNSSQNDVRYRMRMTVHSASRLPLVKGRDGRPVRPNVYVSYRGDRQQDTSAVVANCTDPVWEWTTEFSISNDRKNMVLKLWHCCASSGDRVLGFICLDLPSTPYPRPICGNYDLVDLSRSSTGRIKLTLESVIPDEKLALGTATKAVNTSIYSPPKAKSVAKQSISPIDPYLEIASRSLLADQLRQNMNQLEILLQKLPMNL